MVKNSPFPNGINLGLAAEINFIIKKFLELPKEKKRELAETILNEDPEGQSYANAGCEIFQLLLDADNNELTVFMNKQLCGGKPVFSGHLVVGNFGTKAGIMTAYFRDHLEMDDETCDIPMLDVQAKLAA
jgi:hypothetical protein